MTIVKAIEIPAGWRLNLGGRDAPNAAKDGKRSARA
jgi:hypothetical protein